MESSNSKQEKIRTHKSKAPGRRVSGEVVRIRFLTVRGTYGTYGENGNTQKPRKNRLLVCEGLNRDPRNKHLSNLAWPGQPCHGPEPFARSSVRFLGSRLARSVADLRERKLRRRIRCAQRVFLGGGRAGIWFWLPVRQPDFLTLISIPAGCPFRRLPPLA